MPSLAVGLGMFFWWHPRSIYLGLQKLEAGRCLRLAFLFQSLVVLKSSPQTLVVSNWRKIDVASCLESGILPSVFCFIGC